MEENKGSLLPGTICLAAAAQTGSPEGLTFEKGDILTVLSDNITECAVRSVDGQVGVVPNSSLVHRPPIPLFAIPWFHFCHSRADAESLLDASIEGQFLVRPSQTSESVYGLAVCAGGTIQHYLIANDIKHNQLTIDGEAHFPTLPDLIKHYEEGHAPLPPLAHPVMSKGILKYYTNRYSLQEHWGLSPRDMTILKTIGKGEFGEVHAGTYRGYEVAIKSVPEQKEDGAAIHGFLQEAAIMTHLRHKNLVQLVGVVFEGLTLKQIVLEYMSKGALGKYLSSRGRSVVSQNELLSISRDVCQGMVYMSSQGFVHRDLAARNVLLNSNGQAKISDFGMARKTNAHVPNEEGKFPVKWTAPEGIKNKLFSEKSDVWSFGVCLWEIYSFGRVPYPSIMAENVLEQIEEGYQMDPPDGCPEEIYSIMTHCWSYDPQSRPTFEAVQVMLSKSFGESKTPCSSPMPNRRAMIAFKDKVEEMLTGPVASKLYQEAPVTQSSTLHLANLVMIGPRGSGKTSLIRCLRGDQFRQREQPTAVFDISADYCELVSHRTWLQSGRGLVYNDELARIIIENLLKDLKTNGDEPLPPPLPPSRPRPASIHLAALPPLPPRPHPKRMSMLLESSTARAEDYPITASESHPEGLNHSPPSSKKRSGAKRRFSFKIFRRPSLNAHSQRNHAPHVTKRSGSSSPKNTPPCTPPSTPPLPVRSSSVTEFPFQNVPPPTFVSAIPDSLMTKLKERLPDCMSGFLPPEAFGRLIDVPSQLGTSFFKSLLLTKSSIIIAVFDTSLEDPISGLLEEFHSLFSSGSIDSLVSIVLVGTHLDCHTSAAVAKQRLDQVRHALKESRYGSYLAGGSFIVSCSSIFDQSTVEDIKKYVVDLVKKKCKSVVPLRWLRCVRRFQSLSKAGQFFIPLTEAQNIVKEVCMITKEGEVQEILHFLHDNLVILRCPHVKPLVNTVFTDPQWLFQSCSKLLGLAEPSIEASIPPDLKYHYQIAISQGILTEHLLEHLIPSTTKAVKQELLLFLNSLELIGLHGLMSLPISPWESERSLVSSPLRSPSPSLSLSSPRSTITGVIIPSAIKETIPDGITSSIIEPMHFLTNQKQTTQLSLVFLRLLIRCLHTHSTSNTFYRDAGSFLINPQTVMLVRKTQDGICISLHSSQYPSSSPSHSVSSSSSGMPAIETALTVLMYVKSTLSDICQLWCPGLQFQQAFVCHCDGPSSSVRHYMVVEEPLVAKGVVRCQRGSVVHVPGLAGPWFGEEAVNSLVSLPEDDEEEDGDEFVNSNDIDIITEALQTSWLTLGDAIGVTPTELEQLKNAPDDKTEELFKELCSIHLQSSSFLDLLSSLEDIGETNVADSLIDLRMKTSGIAL